MKRLLSFFFLFVNVLCTAQEINSLSYSFSKPDARLVLPDTLREISGLTILDNNTIACVQDENGIIFLYDLTKNKVKEQFTFSVNGDYEGIAIAGNTLYVLRSDGVLFE